MLVRDELADWPMDPGNKQTDIITAYHFWWFKAWQQIPYEKKTKSKLHNILLCLSSNLHVTKIRLNYIILVCMWYYANYKLLFFNLYFFNYLYYFLFLAGHKLTWNCCHLSMTLHVLMTNRHETNSWINCLVYIKNHITYFGLTILPCWR